MPTSGNDFIRSLFLFKDQYLLPVLVGGSGSRCLVFFGGRWGGLFPLFCKKIAASNERWFPSARMALPASAVVASAEQPSRHASEACHAGCLSGVFAEPRLDPGPREAGGRVQNAEECWLPLVAVW